MNFIRVNLSPYPELVINKNYYKITFNLYYKVI